MRRLFTAVKIKPDPGLKKVMEDFRNELRNEKIKWVNPENIHITLKFFGETPEKKLPLIKSALKESSEDVFSFDIIIKSCGTFGSPRFPRVIWLGLEQNEELKHLYNNINENLSKEGYTPEKRGFSPHLTIGRVKHIKDLYTLDALTSKYNEEKFMTQKVNDFQLFESILKKEGPEYIVLENFKLLQE